MVRPPYEWKIFSLRLGGILDTDWSLWAGIDLSFVVYLACIVSDRVELPELSPTAGSSLEANILALLKS